MSLVPEVEWPPPRASKTTLVPAKRACPKVQPGGSAMSSVTLFEPGAIAVLEGNT